MLLPFILCTTAAVNDAELCCFAYLSALASRATPGCWKCASHRADEVNYPALGRCKFVVEWSAIYWPCSVTASFHRRCRRRRGFSLSH